VPNLPHDITDLHLAPVVLAIDARITALGALDFETLVLRVALESNCPDWSRDDRERGLLESARHFIDCRGWVLSWDPRGIRLSHDEHSVVLGVPPTFDDYLSGARVARDRVTPGLASNHL
jgi:hypothetical protein